MKIFHFLKIDFDKNRVYGLDILRAIAILLVVEEHGNYLLPAKVSKYFITFDGVSIFFVLSGFLIGGILIKILEREKITLKTLLNFWTRRWFRTLPNYFLILTLLASLSLFFVKNFDLWSIRKYFLFLQNFNSPHPAFFPEAWSLSVEEWFYLLTPVVLFLNAYIFKILPKRNIIITAITILFFAVGFRFYRYSNFPISTINEWDNMFRKQVITRLDSLIWGLLGAYCYYYYKSSWIKNRKFFFVTGVFILIAQKAIELLHLNGLGVYYCVFSFSISSIGTLFLLPALSELKTGKGLLYKYITCISLISYSMYLINLSVIQIWVLKYINFNLSEIPMVLIKYVLYWIFTIVGSIIIFKYFERNLTKLRDKLT